VVSADRICVTARDHLLRSGRLGSPAAPLTVQDFVPRHDVPALDNPAYAALTSVHARFAHRNGRAVRYVPGTVRFVGLPRSPSSAEWRDAAELIEPGSALAVIGDRCAPPDDWTVTRTFEVVQMLEHHVAASQGPGVVPLGAEDVPEMLELVRLTNPGPFDERTVELGDYVGIRDAGVLVAMAGERLHFTGWTEVSAVCTAPSHRGRGLASLLVLTLVARIHERRGRALLHVGTANTDALRLYEGLGFRARRELTIAVMVPSGP
jgi:ribosomal protein S18 acetylase RimI-like enzyme